MDKIQIYTTTLWILIIAGRSFAGFAAPDKLPTQWTNAQNMAVLPISVLLNLPMLGRIFGWW
jgi:hypothetical protein